MNFRFQPLQDSHLELLYHWLSRPHVAQHWSDYASIDEVRRHFLDARQRSYVEPYLAYLDEEPVGFVQCYWAAKCPAGWWDEITDPGIVGIDFFLGAGQLLNQGIGTEMVKEFVQLLFSRPQIAGIISDPAPTNPRSIRCLEKAGFHKCGEIQTPDGPAMLMELPRVREVRPVQG